MCALEIVDIMYVVAEVTKNSRFSALKWVKCPSIEAMEEATLLAQIYSSSLSRAPSTFIL